MHNSTLHNLKDIELLHEADEILKEIVHTQHHTKLLKSANIKSGVKKLNRSAKIRFTRTFNKRSPKFSITHFIPASGSGSRMFKSLEQFVNNFDPDTDTFSSFVNHHGEYGLHEIFKNIKSFPFYHSIRNRVEKINLQSISLDEKKIEIARTILQNSDLRLTVLPKALIPIHLDNCNEYRTAFEEQLYCFHLLKKRFKNSSIHFSVKENLLPKFQEALEFCKAKDLKNIKVNFSVQDPNTSVYCLNSNNTLLLDDLGNPIRRPSGHGALISNVNNINDSEIIYISNIDNVSCSKFHKQYITQRKHIIGYLMFCVKKIHYYLDLLEKDKLDIKRRKQLSKFLKKYFHLELSIHVEFESGNYRSEIYNLLNKPIRICGVVPNEGKSGGGPFWVQLDNDKQPKLQIVEGAEVNMKDSSQRVIYENSSHFNPVEMALHIYNYKNEKFDLEDFSSSEPKMIVKKYQNGQKITFIENSGLWNGRMREHLTMFLEIDKRIFNPIKKLEDLLSKYHQS